VSTAVRPITDTAQSTRKCIIIIEFNSIQFFVYLRTELNSRWPITESAQNIIKISITTTKKQNTYNENKTNKRRKMIK
jgi:hypothetical protein